MYFFTTSIKITIKFTVVFSLILRVAYKNLINESKLFFLLFLLPVVQKQLLQLVAQKIYTPK